jgi:hypothetical protein
LRQPESSAAILRHSPSGKVPALKTNGLVVFDASSFSNFSPSATLNFSSGRGTLRRGRSPARSRPRCILASSRSATTCPWISSRACQPRRSGKSSRATSAASWRSGVRRDGIWRGRALPVRRLYQCRCYVRASGDTLRHLWGWTSSLRPRRSDRGLCRHYPRAPRDGRVDSGRRSGNQGADDRLNIEAHEPAGRQNAVFSAPPI